MYVYTDDDLTRINRDYLGPKHRQLPWVATYRTYVVVGATIGGMFLLFLFLGIPFNKWTVLLYAAATALAVLAFTRRLRADQSLPSIVLMGWQEVVVPREPTGSPKVHQIGVSIARFDYATQPRPRWWQFSQRRATRAPRNTHPPRVKAPSKPPRVKARSKAQPPRNRTHRSH